MVWHTTKDGKYRIESISSANFPAALKVARTCFQDETVCIGTGVDKDPLAAEEMLELCADAALDGLSLVAVATNTREVAATVFCKLQEKPTPNSTEKSFLEIFTEERCKRPASRFMMEFMIELDEKCNYFERFMCKQLVDSSLDQRAGLFFGQRISIAIQRGNADSVLGTFPIDIDVNETFDAMSSFSTRKYRVESLSAATMPGSLKLMMEHFFQDEPVCNGTEVNKNPLAGEELLELCADAALDGLSLVVVAVRSGEVVSVVFNKLQEVPLNSEKTFFEIFSEDRCKQPSSRALIDLMVKLDTQCNFANRYDADCWCELMFLGTHRQHRRIGLAKLLCKTSIEAAKKLKDGPFAPMTIEDLGPKYSFMKLRTTVMKVPKLCTSLFSAVGSQKIGHDLGFTVLITVSLNDCIFDGKPYSERGVEAFCEGVAKRID